MQQKTAREIRRADVLRINGRLFRVLDIHVGITLNVFTCEPADGKNDVVDIAIPFDESVEVKP